MLENVDFIDVALVCVTVLCIVGLLVCHPSAETAAFLKEVTLMGFGGLGLKKTPTTLRV